MTYDYADPVTGANAEIIGNILWLPGTSGKTDIKQDFDFWLICKYGAIGHRGSYEQAEWIKKNVPLDGITEIRGHSLGGAVALWLGLMVDIPVITYGVFKVFFWFPRKHPKAINYRFLSDPIGWLFFLLRWNYGKTVILWKWPWINDHNAYPYLKEKYV